MSQSYEVWIIKFADGYLNPVMHPSEEEAWKHRLGRLRHKECSVEKAKLVIE